MIIDDDGVDKTMYRVIEAQLDKLRGMLNKALSDTWETFRQPVLKYTLCPGNLVFVPVQKELVIIATFSGAKTEARVNYENSWQLKG